MIGKIIGKNLQDRRNLLGLSQEQVAKLMDMKRESIFYYKNGQKEIKTSVLQKFADIYSCSISSLVKEGPIHSSVDVAFRTTDSDFSDDDLKIIFGSKKILANIVAISNLWE